MTVHCLLAGAVLPWCVVRFAILFSVSLALQKMTGPTIAPLLVASVTGG
jgi:hypothetical protein